MEYVANFLRCFGSSLTPGREDLVACPAMRGWYRGRGLLPKLQVGDVGLFRV